MCAMETCADCGGRLSLMERWVTVGEKPPERRGDVGVCEACSSRYVRADDDASWELEGAIDPLA